MLFIFNCTKAIRRAGNYLFEDLIILKADVWNVAPSSLFLTFISINSPKLEAKNHPGSQLYKEQMRRRMLTERELAYTQHPIPLDSRV